MANITTANITTTIANSTTITTIIIIIGWAADGRGNSEVVAEGTVAAGWRGRVGDDCVRRPFVN